MLGWSDDSEEDDDEYFASPPVFPSPAPAVHLIAPADVCLTYASIPALPAKVGRCETLDWSVESFTSDDEYFRLPPIIPSC